MSDTILIAAHKGPETYAILYDEDRWPEALRTLARWASNPELSFGWPDAGMMSERVQERKAETEAMVRVRIAE